MPETASIVISYRRDDTKWIVGRILDRLQQNFGERVFMDVDAIPVGMDFRAHIQSTLDQCDVLLAIIGPNWLGQTSTGQSRILDETDWVRVEIEMALTRNILVIPVLIDRVSMPKPSELPESLQSFAYRQAATIDTGVDFHNHMDRLIRALSDRIEKWRAAVLEGLARELIHNMTLNSDAAQERATPDVDQTVAATETSQSSAEDKEVTTNRWRDLEGIALRLVQEEAVPSDGGQTSAPTESSLTSVEPEKLPSARPSLVQRRKKINALVGLGVICSLGSIPVWSYTLAFRSPSPSIPTVPVPAKTPPNTTVGNSQNEKTLGPGRQASPETKVKEGPLTSWPMPQTYMPKNWPPANSATIIVPKPLKTERVTPPDMTVSNTHDEKTWGRDARLSAELERLDPGKQEPLETTVPPKEPDESADPRNMPSEKELDKRLPTVADEQLAANPELSKFPWENSDGNDAFLLPAPPMIEPQKTKWVLNSSTMYLIRDGNKLKIHYDTPQPGLVEEGVQSGTLWFEGEQVGKEINGTARRFLKSCGPIPYAVFGEVDRDEKIMTMIGALPTKYEGCRPVESRQTPFEIKRQDY